MRSSERCGTEYAAGQNYCGHDGTRLVEASMDDPMIGRVVDGSYRLVRRLGAGGFGLVYEAQHLRLPMKVAVKLILPSRRADAGFIERFANEAKTQALFQHPNIVRILDYGFDKALGHFSVMENLTGSDLALQLDRFKALGILEIFAVLDQAAAALHAVHQTGRIHGDVKAENLFLQDDPSRPAGFCVKLLDFGLARPVTRATDAQDGDECHTPPTTYGSPATLPPELVTDGVVDQRADIYSLGALAFELLTGQILFTGGDLSAVLCRILHDAPPAPSSLPDGVWVPPELDAFVLHLLAKSPAQRPDSMADVRAMLGRLQPVAERAWATTFLRHGGVLVPAVPKRSTSAFTRRRPRPLVLAVDDDAIVLRVVERLAQGAGWDCETHASGALALRWMQQNPAPDLVLTDLLMPGIDGLTLAATLRAEGFQGPVVFCTSLATPELRGEMDKVGASWCLDKGTEMHRVPHLLALSESAQYR